MSTTNISPLFNAAQFNAALFGGSQPTGLVVPVGHGLLYPALRKAAITLGPERTPSPAQFQDAIDELNRLIGSLNCDRMNIYHNALYEFPLVPSQKTYTIGIDPTGNQLADFQAPRPQFIERANIIYSVGAPPIRYPVTLLTVLQWARIRVQDLPMTIPYALYNDRAYPLSTLYLYGQPMQGASLELYYWELIPTFTSLNDVVLLPPGYEDALTLNLAVRLVTHFPQNPSVPRQVDPNLYQQARESLMRLESINAPQPVLAVELCPRGGFNIYSAEYQDNTLRGY